MAVVFLFRAAIALSPIGYRIVNGPAPSNGFQAEAAIRRYGRELYDALFDPVHLSELLTEASGSVVTVTDFTGTFEGAKMTVRWSRAPSGGTTEDQAQTTMHFLKIASGAPAAWVTGTDDAAVETAFGTLWGSLKSSYRSTTHLDVYRWNKSGPAWDITPAPYNPAFRVTEVDVAGTSGDAQQLPPQTAISITFKTSVRKRWGRCYLPACGTTLLSSEGRFGGTTSFNAAWATFLNACTTAHIQPVVMSRAHDAYTTSKGHAIAAQPFTAYSISAVQTDDLFDVIRSRRYSTPTARVSATITAAA